MHGMEMMNWDGCVEMLGVTRLGISLFRKGGSGLRDRQDEGNEIEMV